MPSAERIKWRKKKKDRARQRANKKKSEQGDSVSPCNAEGYSDYTAYTAITGQEIMSKSSVINPQRRADGSYNG